MQKREMSGKSFQEKLDTVLVTMAARGDARKVAELLSQGARVDAKEQGVTPLLAAAHGGHTEVCELLLDKGKANIEETTSIGSTALKLNTLECHYHITITITQSSSSSMMGI